MTLVSDEGLALFGFPQSMSDPIQIIFLYFLDSGIQRCPSRMQGGVNDQPHDIRKGTADAFRERSLDQIVLAVENNFVFVGWGLTEMGVN